MRVSIILKLSLLFSLAVIIMIAITLHADHVSRKIITDNAGKSSLLLVEELFKRMDQNLSLTLEQLHLLSRQKECLKRLEASNRAFGEEKNLGRHMADMGEKWARTPLSDFPGTWPETADGDLTRQLRWSLIESKVHRYGYSMIREIILTNQYGANVSVSGKTEDYDQSDKRWWQQAMELGIHIGDIHYDESTASYLIRAAVGIEGPGGDFAGVLSVGIDVLGLIRLAEITADRYETTRIQLITSAGKLIYSTKAFSFFSDVKERPFYGRIKGDKGYFIEQSGRNRRLYSFAHSKGYRRFQGFDWIMIISHAEQEILEPGRTLRTRFFGVSLLLILLISAMAFVLFGRITKTLHALTEGAKIIGRGNLDHRVHVASRDEIGELSAAFNSMVEKRKGVEKDLVYYSRFAGRIADISTRFVALSPAHMDREIEAALEETARYLGADSGYIYRFSEDRELFSMTHLWHVDRVATDIKCLQNLEAAAAPWWMEQIKGGEVIVVPRVDALPPEAEKERRLIKSQGIQALVDLPLAFRNRVVGFMGISSLKKGRTWKEDEINMLLILGQVFVNALQRHGAEREKEELHAQLRQKHKMEAIGTLAGGIAHDFNNILTAILGYGELALLELGRQASAAEKISEVMKAGNRARELVRQILAFSRRADEEFIPVDMEKVVKESLNLLRATIPSTIEITPRIEPRCGSILGNPTQVHQVLMNLCTNGAHAMEKQGGTLKIALCRVELTSGNLPDAPGAKPGTYVRLSVADRGEGISPDLMARIFDPYFTTKEVGKGSGMGLAVVHGVMQAHGGFSLVSSEKGKGTLFQVFFPAVRPAAETEKEPSSPPMPRGSGRVLIVDDEQAVAAVNEACLRSLGYAVTVRTDSRAALEEFRLNPHEFDLVITDQTMPRMTGIEMTRELRRVRPDIPVVMCTGYSDQVDERSAASHGIDAFLLKPVVLQELAQEVDRIIGKA